MNAIIHNLHWQSDWNGYEVGWEDKDVVGLYTSEKLMCDFYIDSSTGEVIEVIPHEDYE